MGRKRISPLVPGAGQQRSGTSGAWANPPQLNLHPEEAPGNEERWLKDMAILRRAAEELTERRRAPRGTNAGAAIDKSLYQLAESLEYTTAENRNAAVRAFYNHNPDRAASFFNVALRESPPEQRRRIGAALVGSGLVSDAVNSLTAETNDNSYNAISLLFLVAKAGHIEPLIHVIETHTSFELRLKLIRLVVSTGNREFLNAFRRLLTARSLPDELHSAILEAINDLNSQTRETAA